MRSDIYKVAHEIYASSDKNDFIMELVKYDPTVSYQEAVLIYDQVKSENRIEKNKQLMRTKLDHTGSVDDESNKFKHKKIKNELILAIIGITGLLKLSLDIYSKEYSAFTAGAILLVIIISARYIYRLILLLYKFIIMIANGNITAIRLSIVTSILWVLTSLAITAPWDNSVNPFTKEYFPELAVERYPIDNFIYEGLIPIVLFWGIVWIANGVLLKK